MSCFWGHKWERWSDVKKIIFSQSGETHPLKGTTVFKTPIQTQEDRQERKCEHCGKIEYNQLR